MISMKNINSDLAQLDDALYKTIAMAQNIIYAENLLPESLRLSYDIQYQESVHKLYKSIKDLVSKKG